MPDLWAQQRSDNLHAALPLAARVRPEAFLDGYGQDAVDMLRRIAERGHIGAVLLWGPPGTGKTTLARVLANHTNRQLVEANAATVGVAAIKDVLARSKASLEGGGPPIALFLDEIHRFNKAQQDVLLGDVERGVIDLIGATTENPWASCTKALVSRSVLIPLQPLDTEAIATIVRRAHAMDPMLKGTALLDDAVDVFAGRCGGDARRALNAVELAAGWAQAQADANAIDGEIALRAMGARTVAWDRDGDQHYAHASALIKSIRSSNVDPALHWLAVMLEGGEDPMFICRRLAISASEDVGLASPQAMQLAASALQIVRHIGMPEAEYPLAELTIYLATAPKSDSVTRAIHGARADVRDNGPADVPVALLPSRAPGGSAQGHGEGYVHAHIDPDAAWAMCDLGEGRRYFEPGTNGLEPTIVNRGHRPS